LDALALEVDNIAARTKFQDDLVLSTAGVDLAVDTGSGTDTTITGTIIDSTDINLGVVADIQTLITDNANNRAALGAGLNSLEYALDNMQTLSNNMADSISRIVDTDYAAETSNLTRTQILQQAATSMLAQANQMPNVILTLLK